MSRNTYTFSSGRSWVQSITCDFCGARISADGVRPLSEADPMPRIAIETLMQGWAHYEKWIKHGYIIHRDWCPACAGVQEDRLMEAGVPTGLHSDFKLTSDGRIYSRETHGELIGTVCCDISSTGGRCRLPFGHGGDHNPAVPPTHSLCPVCKGTRLFTPMELEQHALTSHSVFKNLERGWFTDLEQPRVYYGDALTALFAEDAERKGRRENPWRDPDYVGMVDDGE